MMSAIVSLMNSKRPIILNYSVSLYVYNWLMTIDLFVRGYINLKTSFDTIGYVQ